MLTLAAACQCYGNKNKVFVRFEASVRLIVFTVRGLIISNSVTFTTDVSIGVYDREL